MPYEIIAFLVGLGILYFFKPKSKQLTDKKDKQDTKGNNLEIPQVAKDWWGKKTLEQKRWFLYVWLMIIAITIVYVVKYSFDGAYANLRFLIGGIVVLFVLHAVIWPFFTEKTSIITKAVTFAVFAFLSWSVLTPDATVRVMEIYDDKIKDINENAFKGGPLPTSVATPADKSEEITSVQLTIPVDETVFVAPPHGYRLSSALCPPENVMEVTDNHDGVLRQIDCAGRITLEEAELHGRKFAFFQKQGALQPSVVIVRWVKIS